MNIYRKYKMPAIKEVKCHKCGTGIRRTNKRSNPLCFDCKMIRQRIAALNWHNKNSPKGESLSPAYLNASKPV